MLDKLWYGGVNPLIFLVPIGYYLVIAARRFSAVSDNISTWKCIHALIIVFMLAIFVEITYITKSIPAFLIDIFTLVVCAIVCLYITSSNASR